MKCFECGEEGAEKNCEYCLEPCCGDCNVGSDDRPIHDDCATQEAIENEEP